MQLEAIGKFVTDIEQKKKGVFGWALLGYTVWLFYLSSLEGQPGAPLFAYQDKVEHVLAFGFLACVAWIMMRRKPIFQRCWLWAWVYAVGYGIFDEWHQLFVPGRYADIADLVADACGAALAISLLEILRRRGVLPATSGLEPCGQEQETLSFSAPLLDAKAECQA